ncbi:MAG: hypothetical protein ABL998_12885 [Planctomycetota bacterium]
MSTSDTGTTPSTESPRQRGLRPASYVAPKAEAIPEELKAIAQWVAWRYDERTDRATGEVKVTKVPINPRTGGNAQSNAQSTWSTFERAWARYEQDGLDGLGFMLTLESRIVGIDIDKCRVPATGVIEAEALEIVRELNSYTEVSPSGCGIRIFVLGKLPATGRKKGRVEMYDSARYMTVTGARVEVSRP